jgi:hypothetical protein
LNLLLAQCVFHKTLTGVIFIARSISSFLVEFSKAQEQNSISFPVKFSTKKIVEKLTEKHLQELSNDDYLYLNLFTYMNICAIFQIRKLSSTCPVMSSI